MVLAGTGRIGWDWRDWLVLMGLACKCTGGICTRQGLVGLAGTICLKATITTVPQSYTIKTMCTIVYTQIVQFGTIFFFDILCF